MQNKESYHHLLQSTALFEEFSTQEIEQVLNNATIHEYSKGKILFFIEDSAEYFYVVVSGWVKSFRETRDGHETVLALFSEGDTFGKSSILENTTYPYSAEITEDATLLKIPASFIRRIAQDSNNFDHLLTKLMEARLQYTNQLGLQAEHLTLMTSAQRVACFLLQLCKNHNEGSFTVKLPYEKGLVAARLGMPAETFSRSLKQLHEIGVETKQTSVTIYNIKQLQLYVCGHCSATCAECIMAMHADNL